MANLFQKIFYQPLYNTFIILFDLFPWLDAGTVVIIFTILIRFILFPLSKRAVLTQLRMKEIEPEMAKIKERYKDNREELARKTLGLYKEKQVNPFASVALLLIQLPIMFALYFVFIKTGLPAVNNNLLYSFVSIPEKINMEFLGFIDLSLKNIFLAFLAGLSTFFQAKFAAPPKSKNPSKSFQEEFARSMQLQMKYVFPVVVFFIAYNISAVVSLYWCATNVFTICQELFLRKKFSPGNPLSKVS